jgi:hypothetical protein
MRARMMRHKANAANAQPAAHHVMTARRHAVMIALPVINVGRIKARHHAVHRKATTVDLARIAVKTRKVLIATLALRSATLTTAGHLNVASTLSATTVVAALRHAKAPIAMTAETTAAPMAARQVALPATRWPLRPMQHHLARTMAASACPK